MGRKFSGVLLIWLTLLCAAVGQWDGHQPSQGSHQPGHPPHYTPPRLIVDNQTHSDVRVVLYDEEHHSIGTWTVHEHRRSNLTLSSGHPLNLNGHCEIEIGGQSRLLEQWARREGNDWVVNYYGGSGGH